MRRLLFLGALLLACGDPGPRDRALLYRNDVQSPEARLLRGLKQRLRSGPARGSSSVIGLVPDPLAHYFPEDPAVVVRFADLAHLGRESAAPVVALRTLCPFLGISQGEPENLVRRVARLSHDAILDPVRPFAFVKTPAGWAAIVPARETTQTAGTLRQIDAIYAVAGDPEVVAAYKPAFRKGFFLPGDVSLTVPPEAVPTLGSTLSLATKPLRMDLTALDGMGPLPADIERVDLALKVREGELRADLRLAPRRDSATAVYFDRLKPAPADAVRWLPEGGTLYLESTRAPLETEGLLQLLWGRRLSPRDPAAERVAYSVRRLAHTLGEDAACMLRLEPDGSGGVQLVANVGEDARDFFATPEAELLMNALAGPEGRLEYRPRAFDIEGIPVATITGTISRRRLVAWQGSGDPFKATLSRLLWGPVVVYVARVGPNLCVVVGQKARPDLETLVRAVTAGRPGDHPHVTAASALFPHRVFGASGNLAALFEGIREGMPYWHPAGRSLQAVSLKLPVEAVCAATVEGGALRVAVRLPPEALAEAMAQVHAASAGR